MSYNRRLKRVLVDGSEYYYIRTSVDLNDFCVECNPSLSEVESIKYLFSIDSIAIVFMSGSGFGVCELDESKTYTFLPRMLGNRSVN